MENQTMRNRNEPLITKGTSGTSSGSRKAGMEWPEREPRNGTWNGLMGEQMRLMGPKETEYEERGMDFAGYETSRKGRFATYLGG